jgi:erythritol/L-threitol dehydrogenase
MLAKGLLPMHQIVTHQFPLSGYQQALDLVGAGNQSIKVALAP